MTGRASSALVQEQGSNLMHRHFFARLSAFARAAFTAAALALGLAGIAQAQLILVMNEERILRESAVGQHVANELVSLGSVIQSELDPLQEAIRQENDALTAETSALSEEAIRQRPDLMGRLQQLQQDAAEFETRRRQAAAELQATEAAAMQPIIESLQSVLNELVTERGAMVLLERGSVVYANTAVDITPLAIERMNARLTTTPVNRVRFAEIQAAQEAAAAAAAAQNPQ